MSYLVLARKWRPLNFDQVVGQGPIVRILRNAISRKRVPHAMLFSGVRGVGKTTLARIMAKAINCEKSAGELPCNECPSCREITAGTAIDLHEIDGASNRGIQEIRDLKENIRFLPTRGRYKIMIIDEVHMLTNEAFNALLKTLEEPPDHVIFMFATTELHKIPVTILSRCQRYELKRIPFAELFQFFKKIAEAEKVSITDGALEMIAREAAGSVRDGLSLLDQVFSFGGEEMTDVDVIEVLGLVTSQTFTQLTDALLGEDLGKSLRILDQVCMAGADLKRFTTDLLFFVRGLIVCKASKDPAEILEGSDREIGAMTEMAGQQSSETLYNLFDLLLKGVAEMQYAPHPRLVLEMTFARIVQTVQVVPILTLIARIDELLATDTEKQPQPPVRPQVSPVVPEKKSPEPVAVVPVVPARLSEPSAPFAVQDQSRVSVLSAAPVGVQGSPVEPEAEVPDTPAAIEPAKDVRKDWDDFVAYVKDRKDWMAQVIKMCDSVRIQDGLLKMKYNDSSQCPILNQTDNLKTLTQFAQDFFQRELRVKVTANGRTCGKDGDEGAVAGLQEERVALRRDPLALLVAEVFNGHVGDVRTGPRSRVVVDNEKGDN